jgi:hypothetical protein
MGKEIIKTKKGKKEYWTNIHEEAIIEYNNTETSERRKNFIFKEIINPAILELIEGVSQMPKFHTLYYLTKDQLKDFAYEKIIEALPLFKPGRFGKNGYPVRAYSYYGTIAKNSMIYINKRANKIGKLFVYDFDISYQERKDNDVFNLDEALFDYIQKINLVLLNNKLKDDEIYFFNELKLVLHRWNEIEFEKDKNNFEKLNVKEFKNFLCKELSMNRLQINEYFKKFQKLVS